MGCFLACFGFSSNKKKQKRRKLPKAAAKGDKRHAIYQPLDSYIRLDLDDVPEKESHVIRLDTSTIPPPLPSEAKSNVKIKKKVRFDLNVRAYEPIPSAGTSPRSSVSDEEEGIKGKDHGGEIVVSSVSRVQITHSNYRYQNYVDSYDEDEDYAYQDSDFEDAIESDDELDSLDSLDFEDDSGFGDNRMSNAVVVQRSRYLQLRSEDEAQSANSRDMSKYIHAVLTPVENLVQWKSIKAKERPRHKLKENAAPDRENCLPLPSYLNSKNSMAMSKDDDMVNSSLSSWLSLPATDSSPTNANSALLRTKTI